MVDYKKLCDDLRKYSQELISYELGAEFADAVNDAAEAIEALQAKNKRLEAKLNMAIADMTHIAAEIDSCVYDAGDGDKVRDFALGRCDVCTKDCHYTDEGCAFRWRGTNEPPKEDKE